MNDIDIIEAIARKTTAMIAEEAQAAGFRYRPGHHRSTSGAALERIAEAMIAVWVGEHMRRVTPDRN